MWIKICANTNLEDAQLAAKVGADAVGFVFAPSPRQVTPPQAAEIIAQLPATIEKIGVFPHWPADRILDIVHQAKLTGVQLHGGVDGELARLVGARLLDRAALIQVIHWDISSEGLRGNTLHAQLCEVAAMLETDRVLIDSKIGPTPGGTGIAFPWRDAQSVFAEYPKLILAGGLNPNNVGEAIKLLKPWGVDVASGVELRPGKKDPLKLKLFVQAARQSEAAQQLPTAGAVARS